MAYARDEIFARLGAELEQRPTSTLAELAAQLQVHRHTVTDIVRQRTGVHFRAWRNRQLFDRTCRLLQECGTRTIQEISSMAGFNSTRSFDRFVKRHSGRRPSDLIRLDRDTRSHAGPAVHHLAKRSAEDR